MLILSAAPLFDKKLAQLKDKISVSDKKPGLAVILVGSDPASEVYVKRKIKFAHQVGMQSFFYNLDSKASLEEVKGQIHQCNSDSKIDGILLQLPLPPHLPSEKLIEEVHPQKDADGLTAFSRGSFWGQGFEGKVVPCTPKGIVGLLEHYKVDLKGKKVVVVGRSQIVGRPVAELCLQKGATVMIGHSQTKNIKEATQWADIAIIATGKAEHFDAHYFHKKSIVVDVGIHRKKEKGEAFLVGDVNFSSVQDQIAGITPVPGGVGPMTILSLLENTYTLFLKKQK